MDAKRKRDAGNILDNVSPNLQAEKAAKKQKKRCGPVVVDLTGSDDLEREVKISPRLAIGIKSATQRTIQPHQRSVPATHPPLNNEAPNRQHAASAYGGEVKDKSKPKNAKNNRLFFELEKEEPMSRKKETTKSKTEPELCPEQQALVDLILAGKNVFYTGSAGCGKSTVLKAFVRRLKDCNRNVTIVAPTGKAALEVNGSTYFTFAGWTPDHFKKPLVKLKQDAHARFVRKRMSEVQVLVIDEISMMENHAFERLNEVMKEARANPKAFGGVQLVVTGDFCQLPPVKPFKHCITCGREMGVNSAGTVFKCAMHGEFFEEDKWAFRSAAWKAAQFTHVNLTTIHRQRDRKFIGILERCRLGLQLTEMETHLLLNHKSNVKNAVKLYSTREEVRRINYGEYTKLTTTSRKFRCLDDFQWQTMHQHLKWKDQRSPDGSLKALAEQKFDTYLELKEGMAVVLQVNLNIEQGLVNGSQGVVTGWEPLDEKRLPKAVDREKKIELENPILGGHALYREHRISDFVKAAVAKEWPVVTFDNGVARTIFPECYVSELGDEAPYSLLSRTQIPLIAGWAMTVHKSQGMTLDKVVVDLSKSFEEGQMYVALSRARSLNGLKVEGLGRMGRGNLEVMEFLREKFGVGIGS